jgi:hypothetical protein
VRSVNGLRRRRWKSNTSGEEVKMTSEEDYGNQRHHQKKIELFSLIL